MPQLGGSKSPVFPSSSLASHSTIAASAAPRHPRRNSCRNALPGDALAVMDAVGCEQAALVCQSLGGITGLRLALDHPHRVSAFISCDSPLAIDHSQMNANVLRFLSSVPISDIESRALSRGFIAQNPSLAFLYSQINNFNPLTHAADQQGEWKNRINGLFEGDHLISTSSLARLECPTLFVVGSEDRAVTPDVVRQLSGLVRNSELVEIEDAGHSPYFEQPSVFNRHVMDFLARHLLAPELSEELDAGTGAE